MFFKQRPTICAEYSTSPVIFLKITRYTGLKVSYVLFTRLPPTILNEKSEKDRCLLHLYVQRKKQVSTLWVMENSLSINSCYLIVLCFCIPCQPVSSENECFVSSDSNHPLSAIEQTVVRSFQLQLFHAYRMLVFLQLHKELGDGLTYSFNSDYVIKVFFYHHGRTS